MKANFDWLSKSKAFTSGPEKEGITRGTMNWRIMLSSVGGRMHATWRG